MDACYLSFSFVLDILKQQLAENCFFASKIWKFIDVIRGSSPYASP